jgi:hypothetical protein
MWEKNTHRKTKGDSVREGEENTYLYMQVKSGFMHVQGVHDSYVHV